MKTQGVDWLAAGMAWSALESALGESLDSAFTRANARRMSKLIDGLLGATNDPKAPAGLHKLLDWVGGWLAEFERTHVKVDTVSPAELLRHLMDVNDLKQRDLAKELGGQSIVSAILNGKRLVNARQAAMLGQRFGISPAAFIEGHAPHEPREGFNAEVIEVFTSDVVVTSQTAGTEPVHRIHMTHIEQDLTQTVSLAIEVQRVTSYGHQTH